MLANCIKDSLRQEFGTVQFFVQILYKDPAFEAFDDLNDFVESISCGTSKSCHVRGSIRVWSTSSRVVLAHVSLSSCPPSKLP
jgi:hypothetical protein